MSSPSAFFCMSRNMLRKPLLRLGVRLWLRPMAVIHSGDSRAICSAAQPLRPCTNSAASPCRSARKLSGTIHVGSCLSMHVPHTYNILGLIMHVCCMCTAKTHKNNEGIAA